MQQTNLSRSGGKRISARRLALLASAAGLAIAVVVSSPSGNAIGNFFVTPAQAAIFAQSPTGFADIVAKVKPAVISVRVKVDETSTSPASTALSRISSDFQTEPD